MHARTHARTCMHARTCTHACTHARTRAHTHKIPRPITDIYALFHRDGEIYCTAGGSGGRSRGHQDGVPQHLVQEFEQKRKKEEVNASLRRRVVVIACRCSGAVQYNIFFMNAVSIVSKVSVCKYARLCVGRALGTWKDWTYHIPFMNA
jgi:hypothetical protein